METHIFACVTDFMIGRGYEYGTGVVFGFYFVLFIVFLEATSTVQMLFFGFYFVLVIVFLGLIHEDIHLCEKMNFLCLIQNVFVNHVLKWHEISIGHEQ